MVLRRPMTGRIGCDGPPGNDARFRRVFDMDLKNEQVRGIVAKGACDK